MCCCTGNANAQFTAGAEDDAETPPEQPPRAEGGALDRCGFSGRNAHTYSRSECVICGIGRDDTSFRGRTCEQCMAVTRKKYRHQSWQRMSAQDVAVVRSSVQSKRKAAEDLTDVDIKKTARAMATFLSPLLQEQR